jgi:carbon monoxide dehydrogenase subunit G
MKIQGTYRFPAPRTAVWQALLDPEVLVRTLPGCERLERDGENRFVGALQVAIGPVKGTFKGHLELFDLEPPNGYRMKLEGAGQPGQMSGEGTIRLADDGDGTNLSYDLDAKIGGKIAGVGQRLLDASAKVITRQGLEGLEAQLRARYPAGTPAAAPAPGAAADAASATVDGGTPGGAPAGAAGSAPASAATPPSPGTSEAVAASSHAAPAAGAAPSSAGASRTPGPPSTAGFAARFVVGLLGELIPPERRVLAGSIAGVALLLLVLLAVRACS